MTCNTCHRMKHDYLEAHWEAHEHPEARALLLRYTEAIAVALEKHVYETHTNDYKTYTPTGDLKHSTKER